MSDLQRIAEQAQKDARRAGALRTAIQVVGENSKGDMLRITIEFVGHGREYEAGEEVAKSIARMWPTIWEETMRTAAQELQRIEDRYAPLMSEVDAHD